MEITIRQIMVDDVAVWSAMAKQSFYDTFTGTCTEEDMQAFLASYFNEDQLRTELTTAGMHCLFAESAGVPVAYLQFMEDYSNFTFMEQWKALELKRIYVLGEYHGKGIAQKLMDYILTFAAENTYEAVWLGVWEHNLRAQKFYEKYGFKNSGHTHDFPIGNTPQTDIWMWKFLK